MCSLWVLWSWVLGETEPNMYRGTPKSEHVPREHDRCEEVFLLFSPKAKLCFLRGDGLPAAPLMAPGDPLRAYSVAAANLGASTSPANAALLASVARVRTPCSRSRVLVSGCAHVLLRRAGG